MPSKNDSTARQARTFNELTTLQRDLVFVVAGLDDPKGVDVKAELDTHYDHDVQAPRLYTNLDTLAEKGLIETGSDTYRPNRYRLTERGRTEIRDHLVWECGLLPPALLARDPPSDTSSPAVGLPDK